MSTHRLPQAALLAALGLLAAAGCDSSPGASTAPTAPPPPPPGGNTVPPGVSAHLIIPGEAVLKVPGDTLHLMVSATDDIALGWIGWYAGPPMGGGDSTQVRGAHTASAMLQIPIEPSAVGKPMVTVWARDCTDLVGRCDPAEVGNRTELPLGALEVVPTSPRTVHDLPLAGWTWETAWDAKRNALYFSIRELDRVDVLSLAGPGWLAPIQLPAPPGALDLTPGDDTLVVAFRETPLLGLVDLTDAGYAVDTVRLSVDTTNGSYPWDVKVTTARKALVTLGTYFASLAPPLVEYDLSAGTQRTRTDIGPHGWVHDRTRLIRSGDRLHLLVAEVDLCCPVTAYPYDTASDAFAPARQIGVDFPRELRADRTGDHYLISNALFDRDLTLLGVADPDAFGWEFGWDSPQAISADGAVAYFATRYGYAAIDAATGTVIDRVRLPAPPAHLYVTPDGTRLVARTDRTPFDLAPRVFVVELK
jgi:hypothetical protein